MKNSTSDLNAGETGQQRLDLEKFETLIGLVQVYSPSGQEAEAVDWLVNRMQRMGFSKSYADEAGNAVGLVGEGERQVVLLGHIDTVPGEIPVTVNETQDGVYLHGRGSVDAKGPLAAFVDAVAAVGQRTGVQWVVIGAVDEERGSTGARHIVDKYRPDYAIIGEPSGWDRVTLGYKGSAWAEISIQRPMIHSAGHGKSAAEVAVEIWNHICEWTAAFNQDRERIFEQVNPTLRGFSSSEDGFRDTANLNIGVRLPQDLDPSEWYDQLWTMAAAYGAELKPTGHPIPAYRAERNSHLVRAFLGSIRTAGGKPGFVLKTGTADLNIVAPAWDCPAVAYGPGNSKLDHTPDEHISLDGYRRAVVVLQALLQRLADQVNS